MAGNPLLSMMSGNNPMAAMMQKNPIMQMLNMMKNGGNPQTLIQEMMGQNPQFSQMINSLNGKSDSDVGEMINKMAKEKSVNMSELLKSIGAPDSVIQKYGLKVD